jgi:hypothetical protein
MRIGWIASGTALLTLTGCPVLRPSNSVTFYNNSTHEVTYLSVSLVVSGVGRKGVNVLPEPLPPGESFLVRGLVDGEYWLYCEFPDYPHHTDVAQSLEGGRNYDWYFNKKKSLDEQERLVPGTTSARSLLDWTLGR